MTSRESYRSLGANNPSSGVWSVILKIDTRPGALPPWSLPYFVVLLPAALRNRSKGRIARDTSKRECNSSVKTKCSTTHILISAFPVVSVSRVVLDTSLPEYLPSRPFMLCDVVSSLEETKVHVESECKQHRTLGRPGEATIVSQSKLFASTDSWYLAARPPVGKCLCD